MTQVSVQSMFQRIGARADVMAINGPREDRRAGRRSWLFRVIARQFEIDIRHDDAGPYFFIRHGKEVYVEVADVRAHERHLLLQAKRNLPQNPWQDTVSSFLCGHDERSWFVAAIPETDDVH